MEPPSLSAKKMLRKSSLLYCLRSNENYPLNLDLVTCAASDRIDEKRIYSQPSRFQIWPPSKTKFAEMHVKSFQRKFPESLRITPSYGLLTEVASSQRHDRVRYVLRPSVIT